MMHYTPVPEISISLAPPEEPIVEPYSPFSQTSFSVNDENSFRPQHLTPPPTHIRFGRELSPLRPHEVAASKGLERERFEALLQASRERNIALGAKKEKDLRKEIALRAHKNKQVERRALFLSKVLAPPSPTATSTPKTPPESPAMFHYSLPSPGLISPLALFETLNSDPSRGPLNSHEPWVEQVDFRLVGKISSKEPLHKLTTSARVTRNQQLPSLDQISARLTFQGHIHNSPSKTNDPPRAGRLPAFLRTTQAGAPPSLQTSRLPIGAGRLQLPVRAPKPAPVPLNRLPPSPLSPLAPKIEITTLVVPRTATMSPTKLSESNLVALNSRERRAKDMLSTLKRRTLPADHDFGWKSCVQETVESDRKLRWKRHSAPADFASGRERSGFEHPVLLLPGGF